MNAVLGRLVARPAVVLQWGTAAASCAAVAHGTHHFLSAVAALLWVVEEDSQTDCSALSEEMVSARSVQHATVPGQGVVAPCTGVGVHARFLVQWLPEEDRDSKDAPIEPAL